MTREQRRPAMFYSGDLVITRKKDQPTMIQKIICYYGGGIYKARNLSTGTEKCIDYRDYKTLVTTQEHLIPSINF